MKKIYLPFLFLAGITVIANGCMNKTWTEEKHPNVLFIAVDDLNDWIGVLGGHPQAITPNLDKLASQGISFANAHSNCAACQPSRNSLFSGLMPGTTGWYSNTFGRGWKRPTYDYIQSISVPLPKYFRDHGYKTLGAGKLYHYGVAEYPEDLEKLWDEALPVYKISSYFRDTVGHGYGETDIYQPFPPGGSQIISHYGERIPGFSLCGGALNRERDIPDGVMHDEYIAGWAVEKLKEEHDRPFFLGVGFVRPHVPFTAPEEFFRLYEDMEIKIPEVPENELEDIPLLGKAMIPGIIPMGDHYTVLDMGMDYWKDLVEAYLACVSFVDNEIGRVLDALEESEYSENTVVVLWSDHGQHLGEKKQWRKMGLWEESTKIPLMFRFPDRSNEGKTCNRPVSLIDLYPTLLELCGLPENERLEGKSLKPLLEDPDIEWDRPVLMSWMYRNYAVRSENFRYIRYRDGTEELYDHRTDPNEWNNLAGNLDYTAVLAEHRNWIPETCSNPFRLDSVPEDELDRHIREWERNGLPDWLK